MISVKLCITEDNDELKFSSSCGVSVSSFLEILSFYLASTVVEWKGNLYRQKSGICIGSKVAPVLTNIFLGSVDRNIESNLDDRTLKVLRYVDDLLIFVKSTNLQQMIHNILQVFHKCDSGLVFTHEVPDKNELQFLDTRLNLTDTHVCWMYCPRSEKPILNFPSAHSKVVKNGIAFSVLFSALSKSCFHKTSKSFLTQLERLRAAGFREDAIRMTVQKLVKRVKLRAPSRMNNPEPADKKKKLVVIPYVHKLSHNLRNVAGRFDIKVVFSSPNKLIKICGKIDRKLAQAASTHAGKGCTVKHTSPFVHCRMGVVYELPFSCGHVYIGQTGRCLNIRLSEHRRSLTGNAYSHVARHCSEHRCTPIYKDTTILSTHKNQTTREIIEAFYIRKKG
nr:uncharacterized protein LOC129386656 [Dermacentor andersoni]XP_054930738.1 uncharacterized protein LOC129386656 [Dermacentor andersoni]